MQFSEEHKRRIGEAQRRAWQTKRHKANVGEVRIIRGRERVKCRAADGSLYWKLTSHYRSVQEVESMGPSARRYYRRMGFPIAKRKPGCKPGFKRSLINRINLS